MNKIETALPGVLIIEPTVFGDDRGFFLESYHAEKFAAMGITETFVQDNHSKSARGVLRGLHFQRERPQAKLCRVVQGEVMDVAVDIRVGSPTFAQWVAVRLSAENKRQIFVPAGFAHGFVVLSETAEFLYKCSDFYNPSDEGGLLWNDPQIGIDWQLTGEPLLSGKDQRLPTLRSVEPGYLPHYGHL